MTSFHRSLITLWAILACTSTLHAQPGVCCTTNCTCFAVASPSDCTSPNLYYAATCSPSPCSGACCNVTNCACTSGTNPAACVGSTNTFICNAVCSPCPCPTLGACCDPTTVVCTTTIAADCPSPKIYFPTGTCGPAFCQASFNGGVCCSVTGTCSTTLSASACNGYWRPFALLGPLYECSPISCIPTGACCTGATCRVTLSTDCSGPGHFAGPNIACNAPSACCRADYNRANGVDVQDIFDYLNAWFASSPTADTNDNAILEVADIFAFINAWFAGCA